MVSPLIKVKLLMVKNLVSGIKREPVLKIIFVSLTSLLLFVGLFASLYLGLRYLEDSSPFGPFLTSKALSFFFMTLFVMLVFSNIINSCFTLYNSKENEYLFSLPLDHREIFSHKFLESILLTSWAFIIVSLPIIASYGLARHYGPLFYLLALPILLLFILIPGALGSLVTTILARITPAGRGKGIFIGMIALLIPIVIFLFRYRQIDGVADSQIFMTRIFETLSFAYSPYLPNYWLAQGFDEAGKGDLAGYLYHLLLLGSNGLMGIYILASASKLYYPGWCRSLSAGGSRRHQKRWILSTLIERLPFMIPRGWQAYLVKDIRLFLRDPTQWAQLLLFVGLIFIYLSNLRDTRHYLYTPLFKHLIILLNLGGTGFILVTLTTRFVFPLFSLEGMRFWIIGLAPIRMAGLIWEKFILSGALCLAITLTFFLLSNLILKTTPLIFAISSLTVSLMSISMVGLSTGLGVIFPNLKADSPARIISGLGGTINAVAGLFYVVMVVIIEGLPIFLYVTGRISSSLYLLGMGMSLVAVFLLSLFVLLVPLRLAFRAIQSMEF